jgi:predicted nucleotidyltransferase
VPAVANIDALRGPLRAEIRRVASSHKARSIAVFGSVARGDATPDSDVDFLVEFEPGSSLLDLIHLTDDLAALLGRSVDVVSVGGLKPRDSLIREEAVAL